MIQSLFFFPPLFSTPTLSPDRSLLFAGGGVSSDSSDTGVMEGGEHSAGGSDESPSEAEFLLGTEGNLTRAHYEYTSPDCSEDMEDSDATESERIFPSGSRTHGLGLSCSPGWALAFFGEDCFSPEVMQYAVNLGQHAGSACLDMKTQVGKSHF